MDILMERWLGRALEELVTRDVWRAIPRERRVAVIELIERFSFLVYEKQHGTRKEISSPDVLGFALQKLKKIRQAEILSFLRNVSSEYPDININNITYQPHHYSRYRENAMKELLEGLKKLSFKHKEMEKRRMHLIDAAERRVGIPADEYDLWIINHVMKGALSDEDAEKISKWVEQTEKD